MTSTKTSSTTAEARIQAQIATLTRTYEWIACEYGDDDARLPEMERDLAEYRRQLAQLTQRDIAATANPATTRTAAEARRNAKAELAYRTLRYVGGVAGQPTYEQWMAESTSQAGTWYTVTHDLAHDGNRYRCSCLAGQHDRQCVHVQAAKRAVNDRRVAYEQEQRAGCYGYNDTLNLHMGTQATSDY